MHFFKKIFIKADNYHISPKNTILIVLFFSILVGGAITYYSSRLDFPMPELAKIEKKPEVKKEEWKFKPQNFSMDEMKKRGCVADGILSDYGNDMDNSTSLINRSQCVYLHRALETWGAAPDFEKAKEIMQKIDKKHIIYGMFIAEAIDKKANFYWPEKERDFKFSDMCRGHTDNRWGEHTCIPSFNKEEYRDYLKVMTRQAMNLGIQSFMFGQIYLQDPEDRDNSQIYDVVHDMRSYAKKNNLQIVIGAQTNNMTNKKYLDLFDYIEGGVGIDSGGNIENGPCLSTKGSCWALLWHPDYAGRAKNVFLHLDWSGIYYDDMSIFSRMDQATRIRTLKNLYQYFTGRNMGFMMPYLATINKDNGGCWGPKKRFYSPDNKYSCKDEDFLNDIFLGRL
ncbi:MAG TPA: hypothetical protein VK255_01115 [Patescibacteria group bacterium]|nr:hypothetical protein [Patescibacteria group bacterium]